METKAKSVWEERAVELTRTLIHGFYEKKIRPEDMVSYLSRDPFVWIGAAEGEVFLSLRAAIEAFSAQWNAKEVPPIRVGQETYRAFRVSPQVVLVISETVLAVETAGGVLSEKQRGTYVYRAEKGKLQLVHIHVSNPWRLMKQEGRFPVAAGRATYEYMQQLLADQKYARPDLSPRQKLVLGLLAQGKTYKEIGEALHITPRTVRYHVGELLAKFKVSTRAELIAAAERKA